MEFLKNIFNFFININLLKILLILKDSEKHEASEIYQKIRKNRNLIDEYLDFLVENKYIDFSFENVDCFTPKYKVIFFYKITLQGKTFLYSTIFLLIISVIYIFYKIALLFK